MTNPISVFIMDISNSSMETMGDELSDYLHNMEKWIVAWTKDITTTKVIHRYGDELVVISSDYATAYTLAFYISRIWKFAKHKPYFGLSFGNISKKVETIDINTWIHPLMKQSRYANDSLKHKGAIRPQFLFELDQYYMDSASSNYHVFRPELETLINTVVSLQQQHINDQTNIQAFVCSLYLILEQQNKVGEYLGRSASTISSHMKKGKCDEIIQAFHNIVKVLNSLQAHIETHPHSKPQTKNERLQDNIKQKIQTNIKEHFELD